MISKFRRPFKDGPGRVRTIKKAISALVMGCALTVFALPAVAADRVEHLKSEDATWRSNPQYRTLRQAFQKIAGPNILSDGTIDLWTADPNVPSDSACEMSVGHKSWGKQQIDVSFSVCDSITFDTVGYGLLLSKDKRYMGLILIGAGGNSGRRSYELIVFKRTSSPPEAFRTDYYKKIKSQSL